MMKKSGWLLICIVLLFLLGGCTLRYTAQEGSPIEPITPDAEESQSSAVGQFNVKSTEVQITDLAVTNDGSLTVVGTAAKIVYLLQHNGTALWERQLSAVPNKTYLDPEGRFLLIGTDDGRLIRMTTEKAESFTHQFDAPITQVSVSAGGNLMLVVLSDGGEESRDRAVLVDLQGKELWEKEADTIVNVRIAGEDNRLVLNWQEDGTSYLGAYTVEGEALWEVTQGSELNLDNSGQIIVASQEDKIVRYGQNASEIWGYVTHGTVERVVMAQSGLYLAALVKDKATQNKDLLYLNMEGRKLWQKRLPAGADFLVSEDGNRVIVSSWQEYQDDVTNIYIYNQQGEEINALDVAGRAQKMAYASKAGTLVLGLEDGSIFFLNTEEKKVPVEEPAADETLTDFYHPVLFSKKEGDTHLQLFFFDENASYLIPVTRIIKKGQSLLQDTISELVRGPAQNSGLLRTIPKDAVINVKIVENTVLIDLPAALDQAAGSTFLTGVLNSLLYTVSAAVETNTAVQEIRFLVDGQEKETFGREGILLEESYSPRSVFRPEKGVLLFYPRRTGERYYLLPASITFPDVKQAALLQAIVQTVVSEYNSNFRALLSVNSVLVDKQTAVVDFSAAFNDLLAGTPEAAARAAVLRDALALSLMENAAVTTVRFTVNGNAPQALPNYLLWELQVTRPYYINPEN
ncbi:MAG: GerMN domain-containing protein [Firmicutes bacterium]|nr:GerMN domain-containing protein [Bacillota bacterium]